MNDVVNHPHQWFGGRTFSQHGEDLAILNIFFRLKIKHPSYIDIGAHHPWELSNTALLYARGSSGINIDANEGIIPLFNEQRPRDVNVWAAVLHPTTVQHVNGQATLYRLNENSGINSTVKDSLTPHGGARSTVIVPATSIDVILTDHAKGLWPDLLSIDAEGRDLEILEGIKWDDYTSDRLPKVICVEALSPNCVITTNLRELLAHVGYYVHSWWGGNMLFVHCNYRHRLH